MELPFQADSVGTFVGLGQLGSGSWDISVEIYDERTEKKVLAMGSH